MLVTAVLFFFKNANVGCYNVMPVSQTDTMPLFFLGQYGHVRISFPNFSAGFAAVFCAIAETIPLRVV